jgi:hypothetical protein
VSAAYFEDMEWPVWSPAQLLRFWTDIHSLTTLRGDELLEALDDLTLRRDLSVPLLLVVFHAVWNSALQSSPEDLRSLRLPFEWIETRASDDGYSESVAAIRSMCPYLPEIIEDDLNWTGFRLPHEGASSS